jgi:hypothetical protein
MKKIVGGLFALSHSCFLLTVDSLLKGNDVARKRRLGMVSEYGRLYNQIP